MFAQSSKGCTALMMAAEEFGEEQIEVWPFTIVFYLGLMRGSSIYVDTLHLPRVDPTSPTTALRQRQEKLLSFLRPTQKRGSR